MAALFSNIYETKKIPEQRKILKIIPIFKKGSKTAIENDRPMTNLCIALKKFAKLILKQSLRRIDWKETESHILLQTRNTF